MALTSMRLSRKEREKQSAPSTVAAEGPLYPWGLTLHLENEVLEKLDMGSLPDVGTEYAIVARAEVESAGEHKDEGGSRRSVSLQITAMDLAPAPDEEAAARMFPSMRDSGGD